MIRVARRLYEERTWPFQLARYLSIGAFVFCVDFGLFALLLRAHWPLMLAATASYGVGVATHFTLNKYVNFRAHDRPVHHQASTYGAIVFTCWLITLLVVNVAVGFGIPALGAKLIAVAINVPIGFLGHRHLTFGRGILHLLRLGAWRSGQDDKD
jgi:putative flippase GtrA